MNKKLFDELVKSARQMGEIASGKKPPSRVFAIDAEKAKKAPPSKGGASDRR